MQFTGRMIIGIIIIFIGLSALFSTLGIAFQLGQIVVPLIFVLVGVHLWQRKSKIPGGILAGIGIISLFNNVLHINIGGILVAVLLVYFGYRLLREDQEAKDEDNWWEDGDVEEDFETQQSQPKRKRKKKWALEDDIDREIERITKKVKQSFTQQENEFSSKEAKYTHEQNSHPFEDDMHQEDAHWAGSEQTGKRVQEVSSILGDFMLLNHRFELHNMKVNNGIGDVKIDLSKAIISPGETTLEINGWIGDVQVYVPYDLDVSVRANVLLGDLDILGYHQDGVSRNLSTKSPGYDDSSKRILITLSLMIGDIDVRYV